MEKRKLLKYFNDGDRPNLTQVLDRREERVYEIKKLLDEFGGTVICFKLNIPGPIKNNKMIYFVFKEGIEKIERKVKEMGLKVRFLDVKNLITGPEFLLCVEGGATDIKKNMVEVEEESDIGRLYDIDVEDCNGSVSRTDIGISERTCFICNQSAKICSSSRAHSVYEMQLKIEDIVENNGYEIVF